MNPRERISNMLEFKPVDIAPLEYHISYRGLYDFKDAFRKKVKDNLGDFEDFTDAKIPVIPPGAYDRDGRYHEFATDVWGTQWEYRIFGVAGHPVKQPLEDIGQLSSYRFPEIEYSDFSQKELLKEHVAKVKEAYCCKMGWINIFEKMCALRPFEAVLMDIYDNTDEINELADRIMAYQTEVIKNLIYVGVDAVQFGDDFGTERAMMISPDIWRSFFKPRFAKLIAPIKAAGKNVFFHSCGYVLEILPDLKEIGVDLIWPQLPVYDMPEFAKKLRNLKLACALHIDRAGVMTSGTPKQVCDAVNLAAKTFDIMNGGSMFYVEIDNGFPFENVAALIDTIAEYRK